MSRADADCGESRAIAAKATELLRPSQLSARTKAVCSFDSHIISSMLDVGISQEMCIKYGADGCVYVARVDEQTSETSLSTAG